MPEQPTPEPNPSTEPLLRVVKGDPTAEELAAVVSAVSSALATAGSASGITSKNDVNAHGWSAYWRRLRQPARPGPGAWRASGLPR